MNITTIIWLFFAIINLVAMLWVIIDVLNRKVTSLKKAVWIVFAIAFGILTALVYYLTEKR